MKKNYLLAIALCITTFANASTMNLPDNGTNFNVVSKNVFATNDVKIVSAKLDKFLLPGGETFIKATIKNVGTNSISSVEISWNDGTSERKQRITAYLSAGQQREVTHPIAVSFSDPTVMTRNITLSITQVNDTPDSNPADNTINLQNSIVSQQISKKVVFEEGTGTWCGWCPRGMVALEQVNQEYPDDQISIGVHNGDPMVVAEYNSGAAFGGFPGMNVDRELKGVDINPNSIGNYVLTRRTIPAPAILSGSFNIDGTQLTANANSQFFINNPNANYKLSVIIVEDGVKGTASGYRQSNYYAGGGNGEMGGYESLPNPVPANQMVYDHVGRAILGGYKGQNGSIPTNITDGSAANFTFNYSIPSNFNVDKLSAVLLLLDGTDGTILQATKLTKTLAVSDVSKIGANTLIYPNPAKSEFNIKLVDDGNYSVTIFDMAGREVKNYGSLKSSSKNINLSINNLTPGKYLVNIVKDGVSFTKNLLVN